MGLLVIQLFKDLKFVMKIRQYALLLLVIFIPNFASSQNSGRFEDVIQDYEQLDKENGYKPESVLFTGSSSIRMWKTLSEDMAPIPVINRGFGGSTIPEVLYYADRIIKPHQPGILVLYCGENDLSNDDAKASLALKSFKKFSNYLKKNLPETKVFFLAIKPSIKRWQYWPKLAEANNKIKEFIERHDQYYYVDTAGEMLDENGIVLQDIFIKDNLHMNEKGYKLWTNKLKPILTEHYAD